MSSSRFSRIKELVLALRDLPPDERAAFLDRECAGDSDLRREVESLLDHDRAEPSILDTGGLEGKVPRGLEDEPEMPSRIGPYEILGVLGEGGMGVVYRARQSRPLERMVALKLIKAGMDTRRVTARFESERQTLARMNHPHIATVLDAGSDATGRPYFVMELVEGDPITAYCDRERLSIRERLELFIPVCRAVQHAHQKGIIHRDLKPSNVLITEEDGARTPKVIDFGIAKATQGAEGDMSQLTREGQMVGTPEYMSPEQTATSASGLDTRSDVYSLGVILYELLAGSLPFGRTREMSLFEFQKAVLEREPPRPSTRLMSLGEERAALARCRRVEVGAWRRQLQRDLDWIVLKALEKDPASRYSSVSELAADIERYLTDQPVEAGRPGAAYRFRKFVRRNRVPVGAGVLVLAALIAGAIGTAWQAVTATRQRHRAEQRLEDIQRLANSFLFGVHDEIQDLPGSTPAREYIVRTAVSFLDEMARDPEDAVLLREPLASAYGQLGNVQTDLGQTDAAMQSYAAAVSFAREVVRANPDDFEARKNLAGLLNEYGAGFGAAGEIDSAYAYHHEALDLYLPLFESRPESVEVQHDLGGTRMKLAFISVRKGLTAEAVDQSRKALELLEPYARSHPGEDRAWLDLARAHAFLGESLAEISKDEEALEHYRESARIFEESYRKDPGNARTLQNLGILMGAVSGQLSTLGRYEEAREAAEESLELRRRRAAAQPRNARAQHDWARGYQELGGVLLSLGRTSKAVSTFDAGLAILRPLAETDPENSFVAKDIVDLMQRQASARIALGDIEKGMEEIQSSLLLNNALLENEPEKTEHYEHEILGSNVMGNALLDLSRSEPSSRRSERVMEARGWFERSRAAYRTLEEKKMLTPLLESTLSGHAEGLARCDSVLAALASS